MEIRQEITDLKFVKAVICDLTQQKKFRCEWASKCTRFLKILSECK